MLFAAYLVLFAWLVTKTSFLKKSGITAPQLIIIFLLKVIAGIFYGWIGVYYGQMAKMLDTWIYHYDSVQAYQILLKDPSAFFYELFHNGYNSYGKFFSSHDSWWNDLDGNAFTMLLSLFNLLSFGSYYINVIFYSFLTLFGPVAVYRVMKDVFPGKEMVLLAACFFVPSFIYWTSGIHKDGIIFLGFSLIVYNLYFSLKKKRFSLSSVLLILFGLTVLLVFRNFLLVLILPAMLAWAWADKMRNRELSLFVSLYFVFTLFFFTARYISPRLDFPAIVADKQHNFLNLHGGSEVPVDPLAPNFLSFIKNAPQAFALSTLRPYPSDATHLLSLVACAETMVLLFFFLLFLLSKPQRKPEKPFLLFCLFFSFSALMTIGYTVNFLGAIVRYRSVVLPFLVAPMMALIDWKRFLSILNKKHYKKIA